MIQSELPSWKNILHHRGQVFPTGTCQMQRHRRREHPDESPENRKLRCACPYRPDDCQQGGVDPPLPPIILYWSRARPYPLCAPKGLRACTAWGSVVSLPSASIMEPGVMVFPRAELLDTTHGDDGGCPVDHNGVAQCFGGGDAPRVRIGTKGGSGAKKGNHFGNGGSTVGVGKVGHACYFPLHTRLPQR